MSKIETTADVEETASGLPAAYLGAHGSLAVSLARAEVDQQIATARAMPRSISRSVQNITTLATLDEQSAEECIFALPRAGKAIKGPSIRLAEIVASQWGNCRVGARVVHVDRFEKYVEAEGVFHDLETNTATTSRVRRRLSTKAGKLFDEDMIVVTGNAACAIAKRNAILGGIPKAVWRKAYDAVEHVIAGDVKTLGERRDRAMKAFAAFGVKPEQIFVALSIGGLDDVSLDHIVTLTGMHSALKSGEATVEELFPKPDAQGKAPAGMSAKLDALAGVRGHTAAETETPPHHAETGEIRERAAEATEASSFVPSGEPAEGEGGVGTLSSPEQPEDEFPGDKPSPLAVAWQAGVEHRKAGGARKNPPLPMRQPERQAQHAVIRVQRHPAAPIRIVTSPPGKTRTRSRADLRLAAQRVEN